MQQLLKPETFELQTADAEKTAEKAAARFVILKIKRQADPNGEIYWESFKIPHRPNLNIISCLMDIRKNPVNADGKETTPPVWDMNCLEQVCGICTMVIDGRVRQSCSALVDNLLKANGGNPIILEPMTKFPTVRDLKVDRSKMFEDLKRIHAWIELDGAHDLGPGAPISNEIAQERYAYSRCMTCGCCLEACPQYGDDNFIGATNISWVRYFNMHPTGKTNRDERISAIIEDDGVQNCGNAQNCVQVCPMSIPLTRAIYEENREAAVHALFGWLRK